MDKEKSSKKTKDENPAPWEGPSSSSPVYQKGNSAQVEKLIEENLRLTQEIYKMTKKISSFVLWSRIFGFLKVLLIIAPIALGIIYFKPMLDLADKAFAPYKELLNMGGGAGSEINLGNIDSSQLPPELRKLLGK